MVGEARIAAAVEQAVAPLRTENREMRAENRAMRAELACPICLDVLEDAAALPCGHIFCDPCVSRDRQMRECPVCRVAIQQKRRVYS